VLCGAPEEKDWRACGVVGEIMRRLNIPEGSYGTVGNVLLRRRQNIRIPRYERGRSSVLRSRDTREGARPC
jgi:hypothetical protein